MVKLRPMVFSGLITAGLLAFFSVAYQTWAKADFATAAVATHARALNWIVGALEEIAKRQGTALPPRPIVPE